MTYHEWLKAWRLTVDAFDDAYPTPVGEHPDAGGTAVARYMMEMLRDHMTDCGARFSAQFEEGAAEIAAETFGLYVEDGSIPAVVHELARRMCERIDGAADRHFPPLP